MHGSLETPFVALANCLAEITTSMEKPCLLGKDDGGIGALRFRCLY